MKQSPWDRKEEARLAEEIYRQVVKEMMERQE